MAASFDLFYLFVENVFGGVLLACLGFIALFVFIGMISKMSPQLLILLIGIFIVTVGIGFVGGAAAFLFGIIAIYYAFSGLINFVTGGKA